jgi:hypothetical protein
LAIYGFAALISFLTFFKLIGIFSTYSPPNWVALSYAVICIAGAVQVARTMGDNIYTIHSLWEFFETEEGYFLLIILLKIYN